jgi:magnesium transporter
VPSIEDLSEIESSSRLRIQNGAIYLSPPLVYRADPDQPLTTLIGLILMREQLITVRFEELSPFDSSPTATLLPKAIR